MSLLNAGLKLAISSLNLLDIYKALVATSTVTVPFSDLGQSKSVVHKIVRDGLGTPIKAPHTKFRVGSVYRREQLRGALGLAIVWSIYQTIEPIADSVASFVIPFYGSLKTLFLLWIFLARASASTRLIQSFIQPVLRPYESTIDALFAICLSLFFNTVFLSSVPVAHMLLWLRKGPLRLIKTIRRGWPWREPNRSGVAKRERTAVPMPTTFVAQRVPPPGSGKLGRSSPVARKSRNDGSDGSDGGQATQSIKSHRAPPGPPRRPTAEIGTMPSMGRTTSGNASKSSLPKPGTVSGPAAAGPSGAALQANRGPSTTLPRSKTTNFSVPIVHRAESPTLAKTAEILSSLPAVPQGFSHGRDGGFAFIPPATPPARQQTSSSRSQLEASIAASQPFSPMFPGSFAPPPDTMTPLRMPEDAKSSSKLEVSSVSTPKRKAKSSTAARLSAKPVSKKLADGKMKADRRRRQASAPKDNARGAVEGLFLGNSDASSAEEDDAPYVIEAAEHSPPAKRKVLRPSTSMILPSSRSKRQKLDVLADAEDRDGKGQTSDVSRRARGASAGPSSGIRSRATSVAPSEGESVAFSEAEEVTTKRPLRTSVSSRSLRQPPTRVKADKPSEEERQAKPTSKPPVSGLRKAGKAANGARGGSTTRPRVKSVRD